MKLTDAERHLMEHTTGWHHEQRMYRNHFVTNESTTDWPIIQGLIARGLMLMSRAPSQLSGGDPVFAVTAAGVEALKALGQPEPTPETEPAPPPEEEQTGFDPFCPQCGSTEPDEDLCCDVCSVDMCHLADLRRLIAAHDAKPNAALIWQVQESYRQRQRAESAEAELAVLRRRGTPSGHVVALEAELQSAEATVEGVRGVLSRLPSPEELRTDKRLTMDQKGDLADLIELLGEPK